LVVCAALAALWAGFRPDMVRDGEGRRLPPNLTARLTFVVLFIIGFLALTMAFHFGGILIKKLSSLTRFGARFFEQFEGQAPILALLATSALYSMPPFREVEQHLLSWLHSTRHRRGDLRQLIEHLQECDLLPSGEERRRNIEMLESLEVYVTDADTQSINLSSVSTWRKTSALLRHVHRWNSEQERALTESELKAFAELEHAHSRKTRLAVDIIRMLDSVSDEAGSDKAAASSVSEILARASHANRRELSALEEQVQASLHVGDVAGEGPVRLSSGELQDHLRKIEGYFHVEYRLMLEQAADLAAKSVLRVGDLAAERLDELKAAGFQGLGTIRPLSVHRIIWFLLSVAVGGFLIYYVSWYDEALHRMQEFAQQKGLVLSAEDMASIGRTFLIGIATFVSSIALASLVGAVFGSSGSHVRARETPWGTYILAGLIAVMAFLTLQLMREAVTLSLDAALASELSMPSDSAARLKAFAPWSVLPFLTAVGICWLARLNPVSGLTGEIIGETPSAILERLLDGLVIGFLMVPGFALAIALIQLIGLPKSPVLKPGFDPEVIRNLFVYGFFVGALVVRHVRSGAHTQLVAPKPSEKAEVAQGVPELSQAMG
jgi:hypothetical protein